MAIPHRFTQEGLPDPFDRSLYTAEVGLAILWEREIGMNPWTDAQHKELEHRPNLGQDVQRRITQPGYHVLYFSGKSVSATHSERIVTSRWRRSPMKCVQ